MFGRATIRLGIGPHSSCSYIVPIPTSNQRTNKALTCDDSRDKLIAVIHQRYYPRYLNTAYLRDFSRCLAHRKNWKMVLFAMCFAPIFLHCIIIACFNLFCMYVCRYGE